MGEKNCELCQSSGCKVLGAYVLLCIVAIIVYCIMVPALTIDGEKLDKSTLIMGLMAWTAAMIVPIAALIAVNDWRLQQKAMLLSNQALKLIEQNEKYRLAHDLIKTEIEVWEYRVNDLKDQYLSVISNSENSDSLDEIADQIKKVKGYLVLFKSIKIPKIQKMIIDVIQNENKSLAISLTSFSILVKDGEFRTIKEEFLKVDYQNLIKVSNMLMDCDMLKDSDMLEVSDMLVTVNNSFDSHKKMFDEINKALMIFPDYQGHVIEKLANYVTFNKI